MRPPHPAASSAATTIGVAKPGVVGRTIIPIKKGEGRPPLFLVHDGLGETLLYRTLAYKLDPAHAVYGLQPSMRADGGFVHARITDMAAAHIEQLRSVQSEGPYYIAGLCAGGVIAQEMAVQLKEQGQRISYLGILDAADVAAAESDYEARNRMARFLGTRAMPRCRCRCACSRRCPGWRPRWPGTCATGSSCAWLGGVPRPAWTPCARGRRRPSPSRRRKAFLRMYEHAHREHQPHGQLQADSAVLYRATRGTGAADDVPFTEKYVEADLGWSRRFDGPLKVREVPGGHVSLLQEPQRPDLGGTDAVRCRRCALAPRPGDRGAGGQAAGRGCGSDRRFQSRSTGDDAMTTAPNANHPRTLVVIVNYKVGPLVVECLRSLKGEVLGADGVQRADVVVVENDSKDDSARVIRAAIEAEGWGGWARLIESPLNGGFAYVCSVGTSWTSSGCPTSRSSTWPTCSSPLLL